MLYEGSRLSVEVTDGIAVLCFDARDGSVNKFDQATIDDLNAAAKALAEASDVKGLLVKSAKPAFIVGVARRQVRACTAADRDRCSDLACTPSSASPGGSPAAPQQPHEPNLRTS